MKKIYLFLIIIFLISSVSAFSVQENIINDVIVPDMNIPAKISFEIIDATAGYYSVYTLADVRLLPSTPFYLHEGANNIDVYVYPTEELDIRGFYTFIYNLKNDNENKQRKMTIKVADLDDVIEISSDYNEPFADVIKFYVKNKEDIKFKDIEARFYSIFFDFNETFDLNANEKKEFSVSVDKDQMKKIVAGSYIVKGEFRTYEGAGTVEGKIYLGEKKGISTQEDSSGFFIHTQMISKTNTGNVPETIQIKIKRDIFTRLFNSFNNEPDLIDREGFFVYYTWNRELDPSETFTVKAKTNYLFPVLIIIFVALFIWGFKRYTETKVEVKKSVSPVKTKGGEFALKVKLDIYAKKDVENVSLIDKIPNIVKVYEKFGLVKPSKIDTANRRIQWDLGDLNAGESRVFNYIVYSKVGIVGKFSLPEALAVFEKDGEIHEIESNKVYFLSEQVKGEEE